MATLFLVCLAGGIFSQNRVNYNGLIQTKHRDTEAFVTLASGAYYCSGDAFGFMMDKNVWEGKNYATSITYEQAWRNDLGWRVSFQQSSFFTDDEPTHAHSIGRFRSTSTMYHGSICGEYLLRFGSDYNRKFAKSSLSSYLGVGYAMGSVYFPPEALPGIPKFNSFIIPGGVTYKYRIDNGMTLGFDMELMYVNSDAVEGYIPKKSEYHFNDIVGGFLISLGVRIM